MRPRSPTLAKPFPTTQWSQVLIANQGDTKSHSVLDDLCGKYWRPIYSFARHQNCPPQDAEDITQAFFADIIESGYLQNADREKGRFRTFLIHHFRFFLANHRAKENAIKRGGKATKLSLDVEWAESKLELEDPRFADPDIYFDRQWSLETMRHARASIADYYKSKGKTELYEALKIGLVKTPNALQYKKWEEQFNKSPGALKVALHRLRDRFRKEIELQILETISDEAELKEEMRHLRNALGHFLSEN